MTEKENKEEPQVKKESVWEKFRKNLEVFIDLPTGEWDGKPKQKQQN